MGQRVQLGLLQLASAPGEGQRDDLPRYEGADDVLVGLLVFVCEVGGDPEGGDVDAGKARAPDAGQPSRVEGQTVKLAA